MKANKDFRTTKRHIYSPLEDFHPCYQITSGQRYNDNILHTLCFTGPLMIMASSFVEFLTVFTTKVLFRKRKEYKSCKLSLNMKTH